MKSLWFERVYVEPILSGEKTETVRLKRPRLEPGDLVQASVGPRPPFAVLEVLRVYTVPYEDHPADMLGRMSKRYDGARPDVFWHINFRLAREEGAKP